MPTMRKLRETTEQWSQEAGTLLSGSLAGSFMESLTQSAFSCWNDSLLSLLRAEGLHTVEV